MNKKKIITLCIFLIIIILLAVFLFYDEKEHTKNVDNTSNTEPSTLVIVEEGLSDYELRKQQEDLESKSIWEYSKVSGSEKVYELLLLDGEWRFSWVKVVNDVEERNVYGYYDIVEENDQEVLIFYIDEQEQKGIFKDDKLILNNSKVYERTYSD